MAISHKAFFHDESAAAALIQAVRWDDGVRCPSCGEHQRVRLLSGSTTPSGSFKCYACQRRFSVRTGTALEGSHIPLARWLRAVYLVSGAIRPVGCKHIEEAIGVAPRIARQVRRKLLAASARAAGADDGDDGDALVRAAPEVVPPDAEIFPDVCRALAVPAQGTEPAFLNTLRVLLEQARLPLASELAAEVVRSAAPHLVQGYLSHQRAKMSLDGA